MTFHIPFKGRNTSEHANDNILYQEQNIYIMDNHRLALWCWFQKIEKDKSYNLFHVDAHPDLATSANHVFGSLALNLWDMSLKEYQNIMQEEYNVPLIRWDNYLQILFKFYPLIVMQENTYSATHKVGSSESLAHDISSYRLLNELLGIFSGKKFINENEWIVNLDLDYFFSSQPNKILMFSQEYIEAIAQVIKSGLDNGMIRVCTIALSPECCGGWGNAEIVLSIFTKVLNIKETLFDEN